MPRTARASAGDVCYHVLNRGNGRAEVFHDKGDYRAFTEAMSQACERLPMRVPGWCLMPNHFHLVLRPYGDGELGRWMQWLMTAHVRRYRRHHGGSGHLWQGRFKAFPIEEDGHLLTVLRYIERNPLRAGLVTRAEDWPWSSLPARLGSSSSVELAEVLIDLGPDWLERVNAPLSPTDLSRIRHSIDRGSPYGSQHWTLAIAEQLGLESSLRPRGRPRSS